MRIAILSDIHGNMDAFISVLEAVDVLAPDAVYSLGDNIGYGPEPEAVITMLRQRQIPSVLGNHELALIEPDYLNWFNPLARKSLEQSFQMLSEASVAFISRMKPALSAFDCRFVHGFPPNSSTTYVFQASDRAIRDTLARLPERICFIGHTHDLELISLAQHGVTRSRLVPGETRLKRDTSYLINVGSVGQPRDGTNQAKFALWDTDSHCLEIMAIPYDIDRVVNKIIEAGLPRQHANKLW